MTLSFAIIGSIEATTLKSIITSELKLLKDKKIIDKSTYKSIKLVGSRPGILYGLGKVHKENRNGIPPFRPILSAIGTSTFNLAKFLLKILTPSTANEFTVIDSFHFTEEISQQDSTYTWLVWTSILYLLILP